MPWDVRLKYDLFWDVMMVMLTWRNIKISNSRQKIKSLGFMMKMSREIIFRSMTRSWLPEGKEEISNNPWEKMPRDVRWKCDCAVLWLYVTHSWLLEGNYKILNNVWEKNALGCKMEMWLTSSGNRYKPEDFTSKIYFENRLLFLWRFHLIRWSFVKYFVIVALKI